jgi:hypothetical protein
MQHRWEPGPVAGSYACACGAIGVRTLDGIKVYGQPLRRVSLHRVRLDAVAPRLPADLLDAAA